MNHLFENQGPTLRLNSPADTITAHSAVFELHNTGRHDGVEAVEKSLRGILNESIEHSEETVVLGGSMAEIAIEALRLLAEKPEEPGGYHPWRVEQAKMMLGIDVDNPEPFLQTAPLKDVTVIEAADQTIDSIPVFTESDL